MLLLLFAMLIYTIIYSVAYGREVVECVPIAVVDEDKTPMSREIISGLRSGPNTNLAYEPTNINSAKELYFDRKVSAIVYIPDNFERDVTAGVQGNIALILDGSHLLIYRQVLEQVTADILTHCAEIEIMHLAAAGESDIVAEAIAEPVTYDGHILYNPSLGYGSFVMPSIVVVIIQQTLIIGLAMLAVRRRNMGIKSRGVTLLYAAKIVAMKIVIYIAIYGINLIIILGIIWPIFGFPSAGNIFSIAVIMLLYITAACSLGLTLSHLFRRREAPLMLLLWSSVPILLLAGISYPHEAFPEWLYILGHTLPSSSAVNAFVMVGTAGASLADVEHNIWLLTLLAALYFVCAIIAERVAADKN
ncbi:MAG: ABC transporter permease [Alistipes sp.]|nr:ABC transporter permease [Alistipes sp.]